MNNRDLIKQLSSLKSHQAAGAPDAAWVAANREILMSQIQPQATVHEAREASSSFGYYIQYINTVFSRGVLRPVAMAMLVVMAMLGYSATSSVASASLPGDLLYPIKTASEKVQLALTFSDEKKASLQLDFVSRRADEIQQIAVSQSDSSDATQVKHVTQAAQQITDGVKSVEVTLANVKAASADKGVALAKVVDSKTLALGQDLVAAHSALPEQVKQAVASDVKEAVAVTGAAGADALAVIVGTYHSGSTTVSDEEITNRVTDRINKIQQTAALAALKASSTATSTMTTTVTSSTTQLILNEAADVQETLAEARTLVEHKDFVSAVEKLKEGNSNISSVITLPAPSVTNTTTPSSTTTSTSSTSSATSTKPASGGVTLP